MTVLDRAITFLAGLDRFTIEAFASTDEIQENGQRLQFDSSATVTLQRPNRLHGEKRLADGTQRFFWYNGATVSIFDQTRNVYTQLRVPPTIDDMLDFMEALVEDPHPLADLLYSDLSFLRDYPEAASYVGATQIAGRACDHLAFRSAAIDWQIWVEQSDTPFIRKVAIDYRSLPGQPQYVALLHRWSVPSELSDERFAFTPPADAQKINFLIAPPPSAEGGRP